MSPNALCIRWLQLADEAITVEDVSNVLSSIPEDPWVVAAAADKYVDNVDVQRALLHLALERTKPAVERSRKAMLSMLVPAVEDGPGTQVMPETELQHQSLVSHFSVYSTDELLCRLRVVLLARLDKLETYVEISQQRSKEKENSSQDAEDGWDDLDPWDEENNLNERENIKGLTPPALALSTFLRGSLLDAALFFATTLQFDALAILFERHAVSLNPHRLYILQSIPEYSHPADFRTLLPDVDVLTDAVAVRPGNPWRESPDWTERDEIRTAFRDHEGAYSPSYIPPSVSEVSKWYQDRIYRIDGDGLIDTALDLVQHGASQGVPGLEELGEELGLLARLVYDAPHSSENTMDDDWTLSRWKSLEPMEIVSLYLAYSTPDSIAEDIRRLVMPYLFVLESREERAGRTDSNLANCLLYEYILQAPLQLVAAIFDASKPILPSSERLIKKDEDMARLALACLYGNDSLSDWPVMSRVFECLPEWSGIEKAEADEADAMLNSLRDFLTPSTAQTQRTTTELFQFFTPLPKSSLSRALDVLDVHLESGEILARWSVPVPLRWFLQTSKDQGQQRSWATRMSRRPGNGGEEPESADEWLELMEDMSRLASSSTVIARGAFGLLSKEEVTGIFFRGLLSSGNFAIAKSMLRKSRIPYLSDTRTVEDQVIASSRELYDNASSGNLHQGDMKLAYECLAVATPSDRIQREREFIEATSRICSFNVVSHPGIPISPIEIRLVKDRLSLVARVLSSTEDAYKHSKVILDLVNKLGYRGDVVAEVKTFAMLADAALQSEDFDYAAGISERMIETVQKLTTSSLASVSTSTAAETEREAIEVCWHSCFQLGRQSEFHDVARKLNLLGHALELCPPEHTLDVLNIWRKVEGEDVQVRKERLLSSRQSRTSKQQVASSSTAASLRTRLQDLRMGSSGLSAPDPTAAAALASRTLKSVAASLPFSVRGRQSESGSLDGGNRIPGADVSSHAKQALARGIGWLIGADDE